jgi:hypothetical protein
MKHASKSLVLAVGRKDYIGKGMEKMSFERNPNAERTKGDMLISLVAERREGRADICTKKERNGYGDEKTNVSPSKEGVR